MATTFGKISLTELLLGYLATINAWLDLEALGHTFLPEKYAVYAQQILAPDASGKANRDILGTSRKAEIVFLEELATLFNGHLDHERNILEPIPQHMILAYRRRVTAAIDERWLMIPTVRVRIAMLETATSFERSFLDCAARYHRDLSPHSRFAAELRSAVLSCYINQVQSRLPRPLRSRYVGALLYGPHRMLQALRSRVKSRHWEHERNCFLTLNNTPNDQYRQSADRINRGSLLAEATYLSQSIWQGRFGGLLKPVCHTVKKLRSARFSSWVSSRTTLRKRILVSRGYGGIGDITMMSGGLRALAEYGNDVTLGIPQAFQPYAREYFSTEINVSSVPRLSDIYQYDQIFDFSICPTWGKEVTRLLRTAIPRHIIFAQAMRVPNDKILSMEAIALRGKQEALPNHKLKVSIQLTSDEPYRNLPEMEQLVRNIATIRGLEVVVLCTNRNENLPENVKQTAGMALVDSVRAIESSHLLICPDSAFLHIGEGLGIKTLCLAGPTVSPTLSAYYKHACVFRNSDFSACSPCYRSQRTPCKMVGCAAVNSPCLEGLWFHEHVMDILNHELDTHSRRTDSRTGA